MMEKVLELNYKSFEDLSKELSEADIKSRKLKLQELENVTHLRLYIPFDEISISNISFFPNLTTLEIKNIPRLSTSKHVGSRTSWGSTITEYCDLSNLKSLRRLVLPDFDWEANLMDDFEKLGMFKIKNLVDLTFGSTSPITLDEKFYIQHLEKLWVMVFNEELSTNLVGINISTKFKECLNLKRLTLDTNLSINCPKIDKVSPNCKILEITCSNVKDIHIGDLPYYDPDLSIFSTPDRFND